MRYFFAAFPPPEILAPTVDLPDSLLDGFRPVPASNRHITLLFLGDGLQGRVDQVIAATSTLRFQSFGATIGACGVFASAAGAGVLWRTAGPKSAFQRLHEDLRARLAPVVSDLSFRPFVPHLTLGRWKPPRDIRDSGLLSTELPPVTFVVDQVRLVESRSGPDGPVYHTVAVVDAVD